LLIEITLTLCEFMKIFDTAINHLRAPVCPTEQSGIGQTWVFVWLYLVQFPFSVHKTSPAQRWIWHYSHAMFTLNHGTTSNLMRFKHSKNSGSVTYL